MYFIILQQPPLFLMKNYYLATEKGFRLQNHVPLSFIF